jgi:DNA-binding CsgD family transcriptional regulator
MSDVLGFVPASMLNLASERGLDTTLLCEGLSFSPHSLKEEERVAWADYVEMLERLMPRIGGPAGMEEVGAYVCLRYRPFRQLASLYFSLGRLYELAVIEAPRALYRGAISGSLVWLDDGSAEATFCVREGYRRCPALACASLGVYKALPCHLGLPEAEIRDVERVEDGTKLVIVPPAWQALPEAAQHVARQAEALVPVLFAVPSLDARPELTKVCAGAVAAPVADEVDEPLLFARRLERLCETKRFSARQCALLKLVVEGRSNKEIAGALGCTLGTTQNYLTQLYRQAGVDSRAELAALFWGIAPGGSNGAAE